VSEAGDPGGPHGQPLHGDPAARVLVAGATGLTGALAARLVWRHPRIELAAATSRSHAGERLDALYPHHRVPIVLEELDLDRLEQVEAAIVAYPHGAAAPIVAGLRGLGAVVVDLSADFRLRELPEYERWYGPHGDPDLLANSVYGLTELNRESVREAELIGNPGCYPTAALLALAPLAEAGLVVDVVIDAKSGVSGAGRNGGERLSFINVDQNLTPYGTAGHRHSPEIAQGLAALGAGEARVTFMPHLLPVEQGLLASCYVTLAHEVEPEELTTLYCRRYADEPFVELVGSAPGVREVRDTNLCRIHVTRDEAGGRAVVFAAIDNLWKGASGQAVQNLNLMLGLEETEGLS
jgi:N-acetyl-gamma-glutamyl-phosphate reductase